MRKNHSTPWSSLTRWTAFGAVLLNGIVFCLIVILLVADSGMRNPTGFIIGLLSATPYLVLAYAAFWGRFHLLISILMLLASLAAAVFGLAILIESLYFNPSIFSGMLLFIIPVVLWPIVILIALMAVGVHLLVARSAEKQKSTE